MHTLSLDGKNGVLFINGTCQEAVPTCQALCCRRWEIPLTQAEYESGLYQAQALCRVDSQECIGTHAQCPQRLFRLKLKPDNSCWHLTGESLCSIYEKRPAVCRAFSCAGGWTLGHVRQVQEKNQESLPAELVKKGWENFHSSMVFKRSAENLLKTVFANPELGEMVLVVKPTEACRTITLRSSLADQSISDSFFENVYAHINGIATLGQVVAAVQNSVESPAVDIKVRKVVDILRQCKLVYLVR